MKRKPRWFASYFGPNWNYDAGQVAQVAFLVRHDLTNGYGEVAPCALEIGVHYGRTAEARMDDRLNWLCRPYARCDAGLIATRLAGGVE